MSETTEKEFKFVLKKGKKEVEIQGVSMEEMIDGDKPVISVFINGENGAREVIHFPRDPSASLSDFESVENEVYTLSKVEVK